MFKKAQIHAKLHAEANDENRMKSNYWFSSCCVGSTAPLSDNVEVGKIEPVLCQYICTGSTSDLLKFSF